MKPGIYHITFASPTTHTSGEGLAVLKDGTINGGDLGYLFIGKFSIKDSAMSAKLKIKQWNPRVTSVFGNIPEFDLDLAGSITDDFKSFSARGGVVGRPQMSISIDGARLADAA